MIFIKHLLSLSVFMMLLTAPIAHASPTILSQTALGEMGYKTIKSRYDNGDLCDRYEGTSKALKTYQTIKSRLPLPQQTNIYYRFTLIKEVFDNKQQAQQRLQQTRPPYAFKTDSLYGKTCALKKGFVMDNKVYFVATDAGLFTPELDSILAQLKQHIAAETH